MNVFNVHNYTSYAPTAGVGVVPSIAVKLLFGAQGMFPRSLNTPVVALVSTLVLYFVLVRMLQAVACVQSHLFSGYNSVPAPIVMNTGAVIVVASGIACATTIQYLHPS
jgi:hypothetical protein